MEERFPKDRLWNGDMNSYYFPVDTIAAMNAGANPYEQYTSARSRIDQVSCNVESCMYHSEDDLCMAHGITVGPENARTEGETLCATYRHK
ncbi:DUF1540 domain-containing protein [Papillibacter cinnamivorans]|uniref:DUF1540 domain-containing protein n=1 Tax=Papillibacter cinnamivorans DSM 12816 TaxID=1122930 RepID=A0A1W1YU48_9FIRM|nr:DUF1540 domain-containing protein [Papillibacter cinnamivorans]SMC39730.1 protein of unknown function [Papillibacter cinnamivorans DSM 12816]